MELAERRRLTLVAMKTVPLILWSIAAAAIALAAACAAETHTEREPAPPSDRGRTERVFDPLAEAAMERLDHRVRYDGSYRTIPYPGGDVPDDVGVCSDLVIRSFRALGIDLQSLVHEDMSTAFSAYPGRWGLAAPDPNIDHRRVPNLEVFFSRHGECLPITSDPEGYRPGDLVTWSLGPLPHIGIVSGLRSEDGRRPLVIHNIGRGPELEDMLFDFPVVGHFRYPRTPGPQPPGESPQPAS